MVCIRGFNAHGTDDGHETARQIKNSVRKDQKRVHVLEGEARHIQGKKVKGEFDKGYYLDRFVSLIVQLWPMVAIWWIV